MQVKSLFLILSLIFLIGLVSPQIYDDCEIYGNCLEIVPEEVDNSTFFANQSAFWNTLSLGPLDDVNITQFLSNGGTLNFNESYMTSLIFNDTLTEGSVLFADVNGLITENNNNLFWDNSSEFLRVSELKVKDDVDGGDVSITLHNSAAGGSTDETVSLKIMTAPSVGASMGKIVFGRLDDYSGGGREDSFMDFYTTSSGTNRLAVRIDDSQNFDFQDGDLTTTGLGTIDRLQINGQSAFGSEAVLGGDTGDSVVNVEKQFDSIPLFTTAEMHTMKGTIGTGNGAGQSMTTSGSYFEDLSASGSFLLAKNQLIQTTIQHTGGTYSIVSDLAILPVTSGTGGTTAIWNHLVIAGITSSSSQAITTEFAINIATVMDQAATAWGIFDAGNNWAMAADNAKFFQGAAQESSSYYDGTNQILNPKEVGNGILNVLGGFDVGTSAEEEDVNFYGNGTDERMFWNSSEGKLIVQADSGVDGSNAATLQLRTTTNGFGWSGTVPWAKIDFFSEDMSGSESQRNNVKASIGASVTPTETSGAQGQLIFMTRSNNEGLRETMALNHLGQLKVDSGTSFRTTYAGIDHSGIKVIASSVGGADRFGAAIMFGSDDPSFTTTNPKTLAYIMSKSSEPYVNDLDSGMYLEIGTTPNDNGTNPSPIPGLVITENQEVVIGFNATRFARATLDVLGDVVTDGNITVGDKICFDSACEHFINLNRNGNSFDGISVNATWLGETIIADDGDISYLVTSENRTNLWLQTGRNNSYGGFGNSFGVIPNYMAEENFTESGIINLTKASDYVFLCSFFNVTCLFTADTLGNAIDLLPGGPLLWTMGDLEVWQSLNVMRGGLVHKNFDIVLTDGHDADIIGGGLHVRESRIELVGFPLGAQVTRLFAGFEDDVLSPMVLITSGKGGDEWEAQPSPFCPPGSDFCSHAGPAGGSGNTTMQVNFSTQDLDNLNFSFMLNTFEMSSGGNLEVVIDNNVGNRETLYSLVSADVFDSKISPSISSVYNDKAKITLEFFFSSSHPNRGDIWIDAINMTGNATTSTEANITKFDSEFRLGDGALRGDGSGRSVHDIFWNDSTLTLEIPGNTSFIDVTEVTLNVTTNASIGDLLSVDFIGPLNNNNVTFLSDININGNIFIGNNVTLDSGAKFWSNATCTFISSPNGGTVLEVCDP